MRVVGWIAAAAVAIAIVGGVEAASLARHQTADPKLAAATPRVALTVAGPDVDAGVAPTRVHQRPSPVPSPTVPATAAPPAPAPAPRPPAIIVNSTQQALINQDRAAHGLGPLSWSSCLYGVAVSNARRIAAQGYLSHTNGAQSDLSCGLGYQGGENIGYWTGGVNDSQLNTMFMNSPEHRANILGPYHYVATAWVVAANGTAYIAVEFN